MDFFSFGFFNIVKVFWTHDKGMLEFDLFGVLKSQNTLILIIERLLAHTDTIVFKSIKFF